MLIAVERLLTRLRQPASRAAELDALRGRLRAERGTQPGAGEPALAQRILVAKHAISAALQDVSSCGGCATGLPAPHGSYAGGACCSGITAELFDDPELAALALAGTRPADLTPPAGADLHAGCAFRGPRGCTLEVAHRPARCVRYVCDTLRGELRRTGRLAAVGRLLAELQRDMRELSALRAARADREVLAPLVAALEDHAQR